MADKAVEAVFQELGFPTARAWLPGAVAYSVARTYNLLIRELAQVYSRFGLTAPSFNLLMLLKHGQDPEAMTQQAIGKRLVVSPSDMTGLIDRLERKGMVQRRPGNDRRSKLLRVTAKGSRLLEEIWPQHEAMIRRLAGALAHGEAERLVRSLAKVRKAAA